MTARLISVNVGMPKDVPWNGKTVHTGIWKTPVEGPVMARRLNIDGDGQGDLAGHGGEQRAVMVYQTESYDYWRDYLGRDDLQPGNFGENFTVSGLPDRDVCIGDRYRIGEAEFEVTQPRVTCFRVGLRLGEPRLPSLLVAHRRPGFYLRVLREGVVEAGDPIVKVWADPERMTVADVDALLYLPGHDRAEVARALRIAALSPGWQGSFEALLDTEAGATGNAGLSEAEPPVAWSGFRSVRLASSDGEPLAAALSGQFVAMRLQRGDGQPPISRSYSLSGPPGSPDYRV